MIYIHTKCVWESNSNVFNFNFGRVIYDDIIGSKTPLRVNTHVRSA